MYPDKLDENLAFKLVLNYLGLLIDKPENVRREIWNKIFSFSQYFFIIVPIVIFLVTLKTIFYVLIYEFLVAVDEMGH